MDSIVLLNPSDIISESMHKINYNFQVIASNEDITDYKLEQLSKQVRGELDEVLIDVAGKEIQIMRGMNSLSNQISELPTLDKLQGAIDVAISNASNDLEEFVVRTAGQQISKSLSGYAKTSQIDKKIQDYMSSSSFTQYESNVALKMASMTSVVGNSKFLKDANGYLVFLNGNTSTYKTIEAYYASLTGADKQYVDGSSTAARKLDDPDVVARLVTLCEQRFKTVATELATISQVVDGIEGVSSTSIVNMVQNPDGADIVAAIFAEANRRDGSSIFLKADHLRMNGSDVKIDTDNFKVNVNGDGKVVVKGEIEATKLKILGYDLTNTTQATNYIRSLIGDGDDTPVTPGGGGSDNDYDDSWLTGAFREISAADGILLAGNLLVGSSEGNVTAGVMGANTSGDDIRFWAGDNFENRANAEFRVYESGKLVATNVVVTGEITATKLTLNSSAQNSLKSFIIGVGNDQHWGENSGEPSGGDGSDNDYDDSWLTGAFKEISAENGILLAGNLLVGSSEGNVTAGMMGASTSGNDLRFFAGSSFANRTNAPFRVYEDGTIVAKNISELNSPSDSTYIDSNGILHANGAIISGDITANSVNTVGNTGMNTVINNGNLKIYNGSTSSSANLRAEFGLESDGSVVLKFYDTSGNVMYDLGPNGITHLGDQVRMPEINAYDFRYSNEKPAIDQTFEYSQFGTSSHTLYQYIDGQKITTIGSASAVQYYNPISRTYQSEHSPLHNKWMRSSIPSTNNIISTTSVRAVYYVVNPRQWDQVMDVSDYQTALLLVLKSGSETYNGYIRYNATTGKIVEVDDGGY